MVPPTPTNVSRAWHADNHIVVAWQAAASPHRFVVERHNYVLGVWANIATVPGSARSWVETGTYPNGMWRYGIRAMDAQGRKSERGLSPEIRTTPVAGRVSAQRLSATSARLTVQHEALFGVVHGWQQQTSADGGSSWGSWSNVAGATGLSMTVTQTNVTVDPALSYRWRNIVTVSSPTLQATSEATTPILYVQRPNKPRLTGPNTVQSSAAQTLFTWSHESVDGSPQSAYELRTRPVGNGWATVSGTTVQERSVSISVPGMYEWQVRTKGAHADWSDWSDVGVVEVVNPPAVTITSPTDGGTIPGNILAATIAYVDDSGAVMRSWSAELLDADGDTLATRSGTGLTVRFPNTPLENHTDYELRVTVLSASGLTSFPDSVQFSTDFAGPATPSVTAAWLPDEGMVAVSTSPGTGSPATVRLRIERSIDGGEWVPVASDLPASSVGVSDARVPLNVSARYRAVATSALGVETASDPVTVTTETGLMWLHAQDGAAAALRFGRTVSVSEGAEVVLETYLDESGGGKPTAHFGPSRPVEVSASGVLLRSHPGSATIAQFRALLGQHVWYRDRDGRAFWAVLTGAPSFQDGNPEQTGVSFSLAEVTGP